VTLPNTGYTDRTVITPYRAGVCWYGIRAKEANGPQRYCGAGGAKYRVYRNTLPDDDTVMLLGAFSKSVEVQEMWLCYKHVTAMETRGYVCSPVHSEE
jgi:hypothetical protein